MMVLSKGVSISNNSSIMIIPSSDSVLILGLEAKTTNVVGNSRLLVLMNSLRLAISWVRAVFIDSADFCTCNDTILVLKVLSSFLCISL